MFTLALFSFTAHFSGHHQIFLTSDLHFSHRNIAKFCPTFRPATSAPAELDEFMIARWNETVSSDDVVYNLGDLSFAHNFKQIENVLRRLNGTHHLIYGNHDGQVEQHIQRLQNTPKHDGLPMIATAQDYLKLKLPEINNTLILFHYPIDEWDGCHKGWYHLHGHIHDRVAQLQGRILNVGWDLHGRFLTAQDVDDFLRDLPKISHFDDKSLNFVDDIAQNAELIRAELQRLNR
ncbi:phosphoesterase [Kingella kingae]|nr:phosphoesterase [Kingella kingae]MDK4613619.1 phosphoesterase [Kingella kingae]